MRREDLSLAREMAVRMLKQRLMSAASSFGWHGMAGLASSVRDGGGGLSRAEAGAGWVGEDAGPLLPENECRRRELADIIDATVRCGRNTSVLLVGARGTGKTLVLHSVLSDLVARAATAAASSTGAAGAAPRAQPTHTPSDGNQRSDTTKIIRTGERSRRDKMKGTAKDGERNNTDNDNGNNDDNSSSISCAESVVLPIHLNGHLYSNDAQALRALSRKLAAAVSVLGKGKGKAAFSLTNLWSEGGAEGEEEENQSRKGKKRMRVDGERRKEGEEEGWEEGDGEEEEEEEEMMATAGADVRRLLIQLASRSPPVSVVVVVEEIDAFTQRVRQGLLYSLLDPLHSPAVRMAVVGVSCRQDIEQLFEKRIRSRLSGRRIVFTHPPPLHIARLLHSLLSLPLSPTATASHASNGPAALQQSSSMSSKVAGADAGVCGAERAWAAVSEKFNASVNQMFLSSSHPGCLRTPPLPQGPSSSFSSAAQDAASAGMPASLTALTAIDLRPSSALQLAYQAVCHMERRCRGSSGSSSTGTVELQLKADDFDAAAAAAAGGPTSVDSTAMLLSGLSVVELYLLVAMRRLERREKHTYNFEMVFNEYQTTAAAGADAYSKQAAWEAFERLREQHLVMPPASHSNNSSSSGGAGGGSGESRPHSQPSDVAPRYRLVQSAVMGCQLEEAVCTHRQSTARLKAWLASDIQEANPSLTLSSSAATAADRFV